MTKPLCRSSDGIALQQQACVSAHWKLKELGGASVIDRARGRASNRQMNPGVREYAVELVKTRYADFGPTLAAEVLLEKHGIQVGRETLRRWMVADGLWLSRKQRRIFHQPREHSIFLVTRAETKGGAGMTQFGRALAELNIEIICANSSQAKGRVEGTCASLPHLR